MPDYYRKVINMTELQNRLFQMRDEKYAEFQAKLTPGIPPEDFIGVRVPQLRQFVKEFSREEEHEEFMRELPHRYYDENMLHGLLIERIRDCEECIAAIDEFLPYVDNWAVCDIMSPKILGKHKERLMEKILQWTQSAHTYTCRFGMEMLMTFFLDDDFESRYLEIPAGIVSEEYYVNMMTAWFFATALAKQWDDTIPYIEQKRLSQWVHRKTIQKAVESRRITPDQKEYLRTLR